MPQRIDGMTLPEHLILMAERSADRSAAHVLARAAVRLQQLERERESQNDDAECFRFWVREAACAPSAMAGLIANCTTEHEYRAAILPVMRAARDVLTKARG